MQINITTPTKAYITKCTPEELKLLKTQCKFKNTSFSYQIQKLQKNRWFKKKNPVGHAEAIKELKEKEKGSVLYKDEEGYFIRPAFVSYLKGIDIEVQSDVTYPRKNPYPWKKPIEFDLYNYQKDSIKELIKQKHGNIELPTGAGKSVILLSLARELGLKTVIVTPSKSIFRELMVDFQDKLGKKLVGGYGDGKKDIKKPITIAINRSLSMLKKGTEAYDFFKEKKVLLIDESHQFSTEELNRVSHDVLGDIPYRLFVSATQVRGDGTGKLLESIIGKNVFSMTIEKAIQDKYLCPLKFKVLETISPDSRKTKDPLECKRKHFLYNKNIAEIYAKIANLSAKAKKESTLILVDELCQIEMLSKLLEVPFAYIHSASKKEAAKWGLLKVDSTEEIEKFNKGEVNVLIGTKAIATGTNLYPTHNTCNWMGGSSEVVTKQGTMGRSTRKLENSKYKKYHKPKPFTRIFDVRVKDEPILEKQLQKRISFYEETGEKVEEI